MAISLDGLREEDYDYSRDSYLPEMRPTTNGYLPIVANVEEGVKGSLDERIKLLAQNFKQATYQIDGCIQATVPSDGFRTAVANHWEGVKSSHKIRAWTSVVLTAVGVGAAFTVSPYIAVASLVTGIYAGIQFHKAGQASEQIDGWKENPAEKLALKRQKAYKEGFSYVYRKDLKLGERSNHAVLLPFEVEHLFHRYYDQTCVALSAQRCTTDKQKKDWLDRFRTHNPISASVLRYVYGAVPDEYAPISNNFETIAASLESITAEFSNVKAQRKAESDQMIRDIESQRAIAYAVPSGALQYKLSEARAERDRQLWHGMPHYRRRAIKREYDAKEAQYRTIYAAAILPINIYFDGKVREAREALRGILEAISQQEANAFSPYYEYAQGIVSATAAAKNKGYVYSQQPFTSQVFQIPQMPKVEINFVYQAPPGVDPGFFRQHSVNWWDESPF